MCIELPSLDAVFERLLTNIPKPLDAEHTVVSAKPKKQKKKRNPKRPVNPNLI
jgi:hypothetical protein